MTTLDDILAITGNRAVFEALTKLMAADKPTDRAIAFVGAGASAGMYPLWGRFIEMLADHAVAEGKAEAKDATRWKADKTSSPQQRVNNILRRLGEPSYRSFLKTTFGPRTGDDGKRYTPTHAALLRLPFRGYVTTNYDPALDFARMELRPECLTTGTPTWQKDDEVHGWLTGDIFAKPDDCPMLWIHGYWQLPGSIVLNAGEYAQAYKPGLYRKNFERLWVQDHLVFVGFGFNDPQFTFMVGEMMRDIAEAHSKPRHIAILGLSLEADGALPDVDAVREWRDNLEADYHVRALFYPVRGNDHSALHVLLDGVAAACGCAPLPPVGWPRRSTPSLKPSTSLRRRATSLGCATTTPIVAGPPPLLASVGLPPKTLLSPTNCKRRTTLITMNSTAHVASGGRNCSSAVATRQWQASAPTPTCTSANTNTGTPTLLIATGCLAAVP
jgi:hypothetical protein